MPSRNVGVDNVFTAAGETGKPHKTCSNQSLQPSPLKRAAGLRPAFNVYWSGKRQRSGGPFQSWEQQCFPTARDATQRASQELTVAYPALGSPPQLQQMPKVSSHSSKIRRLPLSSTHMHRYIALVPSSERLMTIPRPISIIFSPVPVIWIHTDSSIRLNSFESEELARHKHVCPGEPVSQFMVLSAPCGCSTIR